MGKIRKPLAEKILENSVAKTLPAAISEWQTISKIHNEIDGSIRCLCGQPGIKDWYELENVKNGKVLIHIGANCIEYFTAATDFLPAQHLKKLGQLKRQASGDSLPTFTKSHFPKALINYLWENDVFTERPENHFHAYTDYQRFTELVYKGGRSAAHTPEEYAELTSLWQEFIKPFLLGQPRKELHIETLNHSTFACQKRIEELEAEVATLKQELAKQRQPIDPEPQKKLSEAPEQHLALVTLCRRRKNRRSLRLEGLSPEVIAYWQSCQLVTAQEAEVLQKAREQAGGGIDFKLHQASSLLLERLTTQLRKRN